MRREKPPSQKEKVLLGFDWFREEILHQLVELCDLGTVGKSGNVQSS